MGSSTLDGDDSEDKKYSFKICLLKSKTGVQKTKLELMLEDLEIRKRAAVAAEDWGLAEALSKEVTRWPRVSHDDGIILPGTLYSCNEHYLFVQLDVS